MRDRVGIALADQLQEPVTADKGDVSLLSSPLVGSFPYHSPYNGYPQDKAHKPDESTRYLTGKGLTAESDHFSKMPTTRTEFEEVFPQLVADLTTEANKYGLPSNALEWYRQVRTSDSPCLIVPQDALPDSLNSRA